MAYYGYWYDLEDILFEIVGKNMQEILSLPVTSNYIQLSSKKGKWDHNHRVVGKQSFFFSIQNFIMIKFTDNIWINLNINYVTRVSSLVSAGVPKSIGYSVKVVKVFCF